MLEHLDLVLRIALAGLVAALLGLERELRGHAPGIRTHALVGVGAALFTVAGAYGFADVEGDGDTDPARIAAQVATGIGFIGAGAVLRSGFAVRGLTTAATLWVSAAIGVSAGAAVYAPLVGAVLVSIVILIGLRLLKPKLLRRLGSPYRTVSIEYERGHGTLGPIMRTARSLNCEIDEVALEDDDEERPHEPGRRRAHLVVRAPDDKTLAELVQTLQQRPEVVATRVDARPVSGAGLAASDS
jgi:putative Mg2+ transporter-C (MgtC) family protein